MALSQSCDEGGGRSGPATVDNPAHDQSQASQTRMLIYEINRRPCPRMTRRLKASQILKLPHHPDDCCVEVAVEESGQSH